MDRWLNTLSYNHNLLEESFQSETLYSLGFGRNKLLNPVPKHEQQRKR